MIRFLCTQCGRRLKAELSAAGKRARCLGCGTNVEIPQASQEPEAEPLFVDEPPAFQVPRFKATEDDEIDMTPMIDVVFQLLIFFMVTAAMALQKSLPAPVPERHEAAAVQTVAADDAVTVRVESDDSLWVDDALAVSRQDLIAKLRKLRVTGHGDTGRGLLKLVVSASPAAHHEAVVLALDAGGAAGLEEISLVTEEDS